MIENQSNHSKSVEQVSRISNANWSNEIIQTLVRCNTVRLYFILIYGKKKLQNICVQNLNWTRNCRNNFFSKTNCFARLKKNKWFADLRCGKSWKIMKYWWSQETWWRLMPFMVYLWAEAIVKMTGAQLSLALSVFGIMS